MFDLKTQKVSAAPLLAHYDPNAPLTLQADASQHGLGVALLQNDVPVAYASRALTSTEMRYAQIEKECLSVVYGLERFDLYTYGRFVNVTNDHKPLEVIFDKPLCSIPKRLQAMMMRIARYDISLKYQPGNSVILADTLSRAYPLSSIPDDEEVTEYEVMSVIPLSQSRYEELKCYTAEDDTMQRLATYIRKGWPVHMNDAPPNLHPYFAFREELVIDDEIIMKGEKIVVPDRLRSDYMIQVHQGHIGSDATKRRARDIMYWPSMASDIDNMTSVCHVCNSTKLHQQKEPLKLHPVPDFPLSIVGTDIFQWNGLHYLVVLD